MDEPSNKSNWLCNLCLTNTNIDDAYCSLCMLRGGALKQTTDKKKWAHISCALCINDVVFKDPSTRSLIQVSKKLFNDKKNQVRVCQ